jgi:phage baseplate assembly protein W
MITYKGFSTVNNTRKTRYTDFELAKQDLINHFHIRKGEKLHNPNFGSNLWSIVFDPLTDTTKQAIIDDIRAIASYDPRIAVNSVNVVEYEQGVQVELDLSYLAEDITESLLLQFDQESQGLSVGNL